MSKKEIVKDVIDRLINEGHDFHEITQGTLSKVKELEGVSKTTIKRAKNEYKKEKIVVKSNYKETLIKRKIYKYLDRNPRTSLSELREALPDIAPKKVSEYHLFWTRKKEKAKADRVQNKVMVNPRKLKELVFNYLNSNEDITCEQLLKAFPEANKSSVTSYYGHWKKKRASHEKGKEGSLYNVIFRYLDKNQSATIDSLKEAFKDVPQRSLEVYHNLWLKKGKEANANDDKASAAIEVSDLRPKKAKLAKAEKPKDKSKKQETRKDPPTKIKHPTAKAAKKGVSGKSPSIAAQFKETFQNVSTSESKIINNLLEKIEEQKLTLTALEVEYSMLKDKKSSRILTGLDTITDEELQDVKEFVKTYVKGLNKNAL